MLDDLQAVLDRLTTTGCIVTTAWEGQIDGCFVGFLSPCSMTPPRLMVFTSEQNLTHDLIERSGILAVHPVGRGQEGWIRHFGMRSGRQVDKFVDVAWTPGQTGAPILKDALGYIEGRVLASIDCGDHVGRLVEPVAAGLHDGKRSVLTMLEVMARGLDEQR